MIKLDKVATDQNFKFEVGAVFFCNSAKATCRNANKSYHVCKVIVVLHKYHKSVGIRLAGHPANKNKSVVLRLF